VGILSGCFLNANAGQCPPGSALRHDVQGRAWSLDAAYATQGWELSYQSPKLLDSYLKEVPSGMAVFVNLSEYDVWKTRCIYYVPLDNPREKAPLVLQTQKRFDPENIFQPKFVYQPATLSWVCEATAGDSFACSWL
jgi:hypothetical protein